MQTSVTFVSDLFAPFLPDDAQVNPGLFGAELAWWLAQELAKQGVMTSYPNYEDWGWFIEYISGDNEYWLCCGNVQDSENEWHIYLEPRARSMFGRNRAPAKSAKPLLDALRSVLSDAEGVKDIQWQSDD